MLWHTLWRLEQPVLGSKVAPNQRLAPVHGFVEPHRLEHRTVAAKGALWCDRCLFWSSRAPLCYDVALSGFFAHLRHLCSPLERHRGPEREVGD